MRKIALITGATSGIGEACAIKFAEGGYNLIITGRNEKKLEDLKARFEHNGTEVKTLAFDVRDAEAAKQAINSLSGEWKNIDVLINNAGLALGTDKEHEGDIEEYFQMIDTNYLRNHDSCHKPSFSSDGLQAIKVTEKDTINIITSNT